MLSLIFLHNKLKNDTLGCHQNNIAFRIDCTVSC